MQTASGVFGRVDEDVQHWLSPAVTEDAGRQQSGVDVDVVDTAMQQTIVEDEAAKGQHFGAVVLVEDVVCGQQTPIGNEDAAEGQHVVAAVPDADGQHDASGVTCTQHTVLGEDEALTQHPVVVVLVVDGQQPLAPEAVVWMQQETEVVDVAKGGQQEAVDDETQQIGVAPDRGVGQQPVVEVDVVDDEGTQHPVACDTGEQI